MLVTGIYEAMSRDISEEHCTQRKQDITQQVPWGWRMQTPHQTAATATMKKKREGGEE